MVSNDTFIKNKQIKLVYRLMKKPLKSWNAIGKYWLMKFKDKKNYLDKYCFKLLSVGVSKSRETHFSLNSVGMKSILYNF